MGHFIACVNDSGVGVEEKLTKEGEAQKARKGHARAGGGAGVQRRRTEQEEDAELLEDKKRGGKRWDGHNVTYKELRAMLDRVWADLRAKTPG